MTLAFDQERNSGPAAASAAAAMPGSAQVATLLPRISIQAFCDTREVFAALEEAHPYDTPAIVVLPIEAGSRHYLDWIVDETSAPPMVA